MTGGLVETSSGLAIATTQISTRHLNILDTLIVPGGNLKDKYKESIAWIKKAQGKIRRICSVCTGAFALAEAGLLDGRRATTHWQWASELKERYPAITVDADSIFIQEGSIWTSAGITAGIDLSLALIEQDLGHNIAIQTAKQLVMFIKRPGGQSQYSSPLSMQIRGERSFADLHAWIATHLHKQLNIERLAHRMGMSVRNFARLYGK